MIKILTFLTTVAVSATIKNFEPGLRAKSGREPDPSGESHYFNLPKTEEEAKAAKWEYIQRPPGLFSQLVMYCAKDKVVCCFYDDTGYAAGIQVAISKSKFSENVLDWKKRGFTSWETIVDQEKATFWTHQLFFVNKEYLAISKEKRLESRDYSRTLQAGGIWFPVDMKLQKVPIQQADIIREKLFTKQTCIPGMGQHYYYNMSTATECTAKQLYPWNVMYKNGELIAAAFFTIGKLEVSRNRNWFERPPSAIVKMAVPYGPPCLYKLAANPGVISLHFFFVDNPWTITCPA